MEVLLYGRGLQPALDLKYDLRLLAPRRFLGPMPIAPISYDHSRPLDVHRWSDHPQVHALVDELWLEYFPDYDAGSVSKRGPKPKARLKNQFKALILDLYVAWADDPELALGVSRDEGAWKVGSRYNALHLSKVILEFIDRMRSEEVGLLDYKGGRHDKANPSNSRTSRIRASEKLRAMFEAAEFGVEAITYAPTKEVIWLKSSKAPDDEIDDAEEVVPTDARSVWLEYQDTPEVAAMRERLQAYNALLQRTFIDVASLEEPYVERRIKKGKQAGKLVRYRIGQDKKFVRRIFNRGEWHFNGRFYGGFWQQIGSELRKDIFIDNDSVVEVDFKGMHIALLNAMLGVPPVEDPYHLDELHLSTGDLQWQRKVLKGLILTALNARSLKKAFAAFRSNQDEGTPERSLSDRDLEVLLWAYVRQHPHLEQAFGADYGIRLMNYDSQIADVVLGYFTAKDIPVLCVHDSFIVSAPHVSELIDVMNEACLALVGRVLGVKQEALGWDQFVSRDYGEVGTDVMLRDADRLPRPEIAQGFRRRQRRFYEQQVRMHELERPNEGLMAPPRRL